MDYQTFNSQQQAFGGFPPNAHSPQNALHAQGQQPQSNAPFPYGQFANGQGFPSTGGVGGHAPGSSAPMMQPFTGAMQRGPLQQPFSNPPYSQALQSPAAHQFAQNRQTASPASNGGQPFSQPQQSPSTTLASNGHLPQQHHQQHQPHQQHQQQQQQQQHPQAQQQQPMTQPSRPDPMQAQTPVKAVPPSPVSPVAQARLQDRVTTLLEINTILIKEVCELQSQGKAGQVGQTADGKSEGDKPQPSKEYVDYMRRLQANLAYLAQNAEKNYKPGQSILPGPAIMSIPAAPAELTKLYQKLAELYPGWKGQTAQMKQSPGPQRMNSASTVASQAPNSAGLQQNWSQNAMANLQQAQAQVQTPQKLEQ